MNERLSQFIEYKTGGNQKEFAKMLGWSPQYLNKMLRGDSIGIQPVVTLLSMFPELNARWLILGEGVMLNTAETAVMHIVNLYRLEKYMPVMNREQLNALMAGKTDFDDSTIAEWEKLVAEKDSAMKQRFKDAYSRQSETKNS